jgi:hypothetical protein
MKEKLGFYVGSNIYVRLKGSNEKFLAKLKLESVDTDTNTILCDEGVLMLIIDINSIAYFGYHVDRAIYKNQVSNE